MASDVTRLIQIIYGEIKTTKTTCALTALQYGKTALFDFDQSFVRARARFEALNPTVRILELGPEYSSELFQQYMVAEQDNYDLIVRTYRMPRMMPGQLISGCQDLVENVMIPDLLAVYDQGAFIQNVIYDSSSIMWEIISGAQLERAQQRDRSRTRLIQIEYARPNLEMRSLIEAARFTNKNLTMVSHTGPKFGSGYVTNDKGQQELKFNTLIGETYKGYKETGALADVVGRMRLYRWCERCNNYYEHGPIGEVVHSPHIEQVRDAFYPRLEIEDCGYTMAAKGKVLDIPTQENMLATINELRLAGL